MKKQMILKPMKFGYRLRKYILITYYLDTLREKGNLNEAILGIQMHGVEKMFDEWNEKFLKQSIGSEDKKRLIKLTEEKNKEEQKEYLKILFNQALVMACAVLDTYLDDSIDVIISTNKKILIVLSDEKDISIPEIIEANSYKNILDKMRLKVLERFGYKGIEDRLKILKKINLNLGQALKLKTHTEEIQQKYPNGYEYLTSIYKNRNDIVHHDLLPIETYIELSDMTTFIEYFMLDLSIVIKNKFNIPIDFGLWLKNPGSIKI